MVSKIYPLVDVDVTGPAENGSFFVSRSAFDDPSADPELVEREEFRDEAAALRFARLLVNGAVKSDAEHAVLWHEGEAVYEAHRIGGER